jgi:hydroxyacylglutathione hydrolase
MSLLSVHTIPILEDNYVWLIQVPDSQAVIVVDPGDEAPVLAYIKAHDLIPVALLITHHDYDHVDGIKPFLAEYNVPVYGPANELIPGMTRPLSAIEQLSVHVDFPPIQVLDVPGHTHGHIAYLIDDCLFCGDTLFAAGCGRLRGGTHAQLFSSLKQISQLSPATKIYCSHEYTEANLAFARAVEPNNLAITERQEKVTSLRQTGKTTLPTHLALELETNPFLRCDKTSVINAVEQHVSQRLIDEQAVFTALRQWKDTF